MQRLLPHQTDQIYLVFAATGTDLIFNRGLDMPGFASFPLNEDPNAQPVIVQQMRDLVKVAKGAGAGCIIDTLTWMANRNRAAPLGYDEDALAKLNRTAVTLMRELRDEVASDDVLLALCVGPASDAYARSTPMTVAQARSYHSAQIASVRDMGVDLIHAYTFNQVEEAAGVTLAARDADLPVVVSLVVETDGCLDSGQPLQDAISQIDDLTGSAAAYFMVNCAHPDHFSHVLNGNPRLKGLIVNASRCSHAELDNADTLDDGDPDELAAEIARLVEKYPALQVIGGCCGTDMRHLQRMAEEVLQ